MKYKRFGNSIVVRFEKGDEVHAALRELALAENIKLASISGIGAADDVTVGVFDCSKGAYDNFNYKGDFELSSVIGSITTMNGEFYSHVHVTCAGPEGRVFGGHLVSAKVNLTCEIFITVIDGEVDRVRDEELRINILNI